MHYREKLTTVEIWNYCQHSLGPNETIVLENACQYGTITVLSLNVSVVIEVKCCCNSKNLDVIEKW